MLAAPVKYEGRLTQYVGRLNRTYDRKDYEEVFFRDLIEADKVIVISSPKLIRTKVMKLVSIIKSRQESGVSVTVITMDPNSIGYDDVIESTLLVDELLKGGIIVRKTKAMSECYAVIDNRIVWHGGMNLLGKAEAWDNLMRVENEQVASELLEITEKSV